MTQLLLLFFAATICMIAHAMGSVVAGRLLRLSCDEVGLFVGPSIAERDFRGVTYRLNAIPLGSYVRFQRDEFEDASFTHRLLVILSGPISMLAIAILGSPDGSGISLFWDGFSQIIHGATSPLAEGQLLATQAIDFINQSSFLSLLGAFAAKNASYNLLPIPTLPGGALVMGLWKAFAPLSEQVQVYVALTGFLLNILILIAWLVAFASAFRA